MQVKLYENHLGQIRVLGESENPLFCLSDVCKILDLDSVNKVANSIKAEFGDGGNQIPPIQNENFCVIQTYPIADNLGRIQQALFITEPQLYFVLMRSNKSKAKPFRQWVVSEVLPSIRKTGKYIKMDNVSDREKERLKDEIIMLQRKLLNIYEDREREVPLHYNTWLEPREKEQIKSLHARGESISKICKVMQRSEFAIRKIIKEG